MNRDRWLGLRLSDPHVVLRLAPQLHGHSNQFHCAALARFNAIIAAGFMHIYYANFLGAGGGQNHMLVGHMIIAGINAQQHTFSAKAAGTIAPKAAPAVAVAMPAFATKLGSVTGALPAI